MPQLPSGRRIGFSADRIVQMAKGADFPKYIQIQMAVRVPADLVPLIDLIGFTPCAGVPEPGTPEVLDLKASDIGTDRCDWSQEDQRALIELIASPPAQQWLEARFEELSAALEASKPALPEDLRGILDNDD